MRKYFARRPLRRRIVALAVAYAIALSSLIASFGAASAAAEAATAPDGIIICHTVVAGDEAPPLPTKPTASIASIIAASVA